MIQTRSFLLVRVMAVLFLYASAVASPSTTELHSEFESELMKFFVAVPVEGELVFSQEWESSIRGEAVVEMGIDLLQRISREIWAK